MMYNVYMPEIYALSSIIFIRPSLKLKRNNLKGKLIEKATPL